MPPTPDAAENSTDQPDTDPGTQPGAATSSDDASTAPDTGEAEGKSEGEPFPPRGTLTLRALRWSGLIGTVVLAATALVLRRELKTASGLIPSKVSVLTSCMIVGGVLVWPCLTLRGKKGPILTTVMITVMAALGRDDVSVSDNGVVEYLPGDRVLRPVPAGAGWSGALSHALPQRCPTEALPAHAHRRDRYRGSQ